MSTPDYPSNPSPAGSALDRSRDEATELARTAKEDLASLGEDVKAEASALGEEAKTQLKQAAEKAKGMASEQKELLAGQLSGVSNALGRVAGELEAEDESSAQYVRMIADGAERLTSTVRDHDVDDLMAMAQEFGRKQPAAFIGAAALLGFAASRFVTASAARRQRDTAPPQPEPKAPSYAETSSSSPGYGQSVGGQDAGI